ncbi:MAG: hypothetical protein AB3N20_01015 [Rhizobiaceae bacterium]
MMFIGEEEMLIFVGFVIIVSLLSLWTGVTIRKARRRKEDLKDVAAAMRDHYPALEKLLKSEEVSEPFKKRLLDLHTVVMNRKTAPHMINYVTTMKPTDDRLRGDDLDLDQEFSKLSQASSELLDSVRVVATTGLQIALLRWPDTAKKARAIMRNVGPKHTLATRMMLAADFDQDNNKPLGGAFVAA